MAKLPTSRFLPVVRRVECEEGDGAGGLGKLLFGGEGLIDILGRGVR